MALISLDTQVMIWAIRKSADPGQEFRLAPAAKLIEWADREKHRILLPAHAVGEYLTGLNDAERANELAVLQRRFHIQPFDAPAAAIAAKLQTEHQWKTIGKSAGVSRQCIKADIAIIASSIVGKASMLIVEDNDSHFKSLNGGLIIVKTMSEAVEVAERQEPQASAEQATLFPAESDQAE